MGKFVKRVLVRIYFSAQNFFDGLFSVFYSARVLKNQTKRAFLIGTPKHDNLGDHAIALSETQFIKENFSSYEVTEIVVERWRKYKCLIKKKIKNDDIVFLTGGGNFGDVYLQDEKLRRYVIKNCKNNLTVIFPQTVYFSDTVKGKKELEKTKRIFKRHQKLIICAREKISYDFLRKEFDSNEVYLCPDMVFYLKICYGDKTSTKKIGVCFRNDAEKSENNICCEDIAEKFNDYKIESFDTRLFNTNINADREKHISALMTQLNDYDIIITDRLHGMLLGLFLGKNVFVVDTKSPKIRGSVAWFNPQDVTVISKISDISEPINYSGTNYVCEFKRYYELFARKIKSRL